MTESKNVLLPILIGLVTLPRLSLDLFLPSLTQLGSSLGVSDPQLQMTLTSFMFGSAASMLITGPLSDVFSKRRVVIYSLGIFLIATMISALTSSIVVLITARFFQALGGSCGTLITRVMVKEYYSREDQIRALASLSYAMALCPLIVPLLGGILQHYYGWRAVFEVLALIGLFLLSACALRINETKTQSNTMPIKALFVNYRMLLKHRLFVAYSLAIGCAWCNYSAFSLESPFIFQTILGYNSISYGTLVALPVIGYVAGITLAKKYANNIGYDTLIYLACLTCLLGSISMILLTSLLPINSAIIIIPMMVIMVGVGIIIPCTQGAVMQPFAHIAGTATGLFFFIQMLVGGLSGIILQFCSHHSALPLAYVILGSSTILILSFTILAPGAVRLSFSST